MRRTLYSVGSLVDAVKPNETSYRVAIGSDTESLEALNLAVATVLLIAAGPVYEVALNDGVLVVRCLCKLEPEKLNQLREEVEASGWTLTLQDSHSAPLPAGLQMFARPLFS